MVAWGHLLPGCLSLSRLTFSSTLHLTRALPQVPTSSSFYTSLPPSSSSFSILFLFLLVLPLTTFLSYIYRFSLPYSASLHRHTFYFFLIRAFLVLYLSYFLDFPPLSTHLHSSYIFLSRPIFHILSAPIPNIYLSVTCVFLPGISTTILLPLITNHISCLCIS